MYDLLAGIEEGKLDGSSKKLGLKGAMIFRAIILRTIGRDLKHSEASAQQQICQGSSPAVANSV